MKTTNIAMRLTLLLLFGGASGCASLLESSVSSPEVRLSNVQVVGLGFNKQTFLLSFDVSNPNAFPLPVRSIAYGLTLDGQHFASGQTDSDFTVPASGDSSFAISVDLDLLSTAPQLLTIVRGGTQRDIRYDLDGDLGVDIPLLPTFKYRSSGLVRLGSGAL